MGLLIGENKRVGKKVFDLFFSLDFDEAKCIKKESAYINFTNYMSFDFS